MGKKKRKDRKIVNQADSALPYELSKKCKEAADAYLKCGKNKTHAAEMLGIPRTTLADRVSLAQKHNLFSENDCTAFDRENLLGTIDGLRAEIRRLEQLQLDEAQIRKFIFQLKDAESKVPDWTLNVDSAIKGTLLAPVLQLSDWHWAEKVDPKQVFGTNKYNLEIAKRRVRILARNAIDVCMNHADRNAEYPGIVVVLNGDFLSGRIHEELLVTNEVEIMLAFLDLQSTMIWFFKKLLENFKSVVVFGNAGGNHSRVTYKPYSKGRAYTNFDWLLSHTLKKYFENESRISFQISDGSDIEFKIFNVRFRATHGDQFRGGSGFIGPYAPITRGEIKKRSAAATYGRSYDTLMIGHFHWYMNMKRVISNGSLIGFNEYALNNSFPYEPPVQGLFFVHPVRGITASMPIFCDDPVDVESAEWVSLRKHNEKNKESL